MSKRIGILSLQGAFDEHEKVFTSLRAKTTQIRNLADWNAGAYAGASTGYGTGFDALCIPGGESTVQGKLLHDLGLFEPIRAAIKAGLPTLGTCAGLLLLAKEISSDAPASADVTQIGEARGGENTYFATMDILAKRNAFGRQLGSFAWQADFAGQSIPMTFIRAPYIERVGENVQVLSEVEGRIMAAKQGNQLVTAFHPELTADTSVHEYFLNMV